MTEFKEVSLDQIRPSSFQMRSAMDEAALDQLAESLERDGQQRPVKLRPVEDGYEIVFGHRTVEAAKRKNWTRIDAVIEELTDEQVMWAQYAENAYREDIAPYDTARWMQNMIDRFGYNRQSLALRMNLSESRISDLLKFITVEKFCKLSLLRLMTLKHIEAILETPSELLDKVCKRIEEYYEDTHGVMIPWYDIPELIRYVVVMNSHPELAASSELLREEAEETIEEGEKVKSLAEEERLEEEEVDELELDQEKQAEELAREEMLFPEPRRTVVEESMEAQRTPEISKEVFEECVSDKYPAAAQHIADTFSRAVRGVRIDEAALAWMTSRKFGITEGEARDLIREYKAEPHPVVEPPKPTVRKVIIADGVCPECGKKFIVNHLSTGEHTIEYPREAPRR